MRESMINRHAEKQDHDSPWKEALELRFQEFMALLFPDIHQRIDWNQALTFLDKELQQILPNTENGRTYADKLIKVQFTDGQAHWVLIHVEVQGEPEAAFAERMFRYNYRIRDKYGEDVISLAVLSDTSEKFRPNQFRFALVGCEISFTFPSVKLLDWKDRMGELLNSDNPFALIVAAQIYAKILKTPDEKFNSKIFLIRELYNRGYSQEMLIELFRFIDWIMTLPHNLDIEFKQVIDQIEEEQKMAYITSVERIAMQEGIQQGMQQGKLEGKLEMALKMVHRFNLSVKEAAEEASVSVKDLMDYLKQHDKPNT